MILVDWQIEKLILEKEVADPKWIKFVNPSSLDISIGAKAKLLVKPQQANIYIKEGIDIEKDALGNAFLPVDIGDEKMDSDAPYKMVFDIEKNKFHPLYLIKYVLEPGERILCESEQFFDLPADISLSLSLKSSRAREFYNHQLSGHIDPGFTGRLTLELINDSYAFLPLTQGLRIAQVIFHKHLECTTPYQGKYQSDQTVSVSKCEGE